MKKLLLICSLFIGLATLSYAQSVAVTGSPVEKAKLLQKQLKLTDLQTTKIAAIYKGSAEQFDKIKANAKGNNEKMMVAIKPLRAATITKIKAVLKPRQAAAYDKLVAASAAGSDTGWSDGWSATK